MGIIASIILIVVVYVLCKLPEWKFNNRLSPLGSETDWGTMNSDLSRGMSKRDVMDKFNRGGYDVLDKDYKK